MRKYGFSLTIILRDIQDIYGNIRDMQKNMWNRPGGIETRIVAYFTQRMIGKLEKFILFLT